jgi:multisite-specific tRNA:(cytosine-C5)-methyltransferase
MSRNGCIPLFFISQKRQRGGKGGRGGRSRDDDDRGMLEKSDMKNERFTSYYKAQRIIPDEEWDQFIEALRRPLPTTFRIAGSRECVLRVIHYRFGH